MRGEDTGGLGQIVAGQVKWFDASKGFGFVLSDEGGPDILLHANVLRNFGRGSIAEGARVKMRTQQGGRGLQAVEVIAIESTSAVTAEPERPALDVSDIPLVAARVKWFDKGKGFGFANVFGKSEDVFVHAETLRQSGFTELQPGEAVGLRVVDGPRGKMAAEVRTWDMI